MTRDTDTTTAINAWTRGTEALDDAENRIRQAHRLRANAVRAMRDARMTWAEIENVTGLTRQRLNQIIKSSPD